FFRRVMFPDQNVAGRTAAEAQRQLLTRFAAFAAGTLLALLIVVPSAFSFVRNLALAGKFRAADAEAATIVAADWSSPEGVSKNLARLDPLHAELRELERWRAEGRDSFHGWGFYAGDRLEAAGGRAFGHALRARFAEPTAKALAQKLGLLKPLDDQSVNDEYREAYENLKAYLMLTEVEHLDVAWASAYLAPPWAVLQGRPELVPELKALEQNERAGVSADARRLREHVRHYVELVKRGVVAPAPRSDAVVRETRRKLGTELPLQMLYDTLIRDTNEKVAPIKYDKVFLQPGAAYITPRNRKIMVPGAFTRDGWNKVREHLQSVWRSRLVGESWVIGVEERYTAERTEAWLSDLRARYFRDYDRAWNDFLKNIDVQSPRNGKQALDELVALSEPEWPYGRLLRIMHENMNLDTGAAAAELAPDRSVVEKFIAWVTKRRPKEGAKPGEGEATFWPDELARFRPLAAFAVPPPDAKPGEAAATGLNQYMGTLHKLVSVLKDLNEADARPDPKAAAQEFEAAYRATWAALASQDADTKRVLEPLLVPPIKMSWASVVGDAGAAAEGLWELEVWKPWVEKLQAVYPFKPDADDDANVDDFAEFFRPQNGTLWGFYEQNLRASFGPRGGGPFEPSRRFGEAAPFGPTLASCLRTSQQITRAVFADDAKAAAVAFDVNLHSVSPDVSEVTISIDGLAHTYRNTPEEWLTAQWPAKNAKERGAKIVVRGFAGLKESIDRSGDFGLFRLLEAAEIRPVAGAARRGRPPAFVASWKLSTLPGA
ncbi:MAG TPA: ImcF-related family protein, partial [Polyangiaceae bacterium]|nr:ImcF-related family protein [Polyangiaceae bacterium]